MDKVASDVLDKVLLNHEVVVVKVYASWCKFCPKITPHLERLEKEYTDFRFVEVEVGDRNNNLHTEFKITNKIKTFPTILVFKNSKEAGRIVGTTENKQDVNYEYILSRLECFINSVCEQEPEGGKPMTTDKESRKKDIKAAVYDEMVKVESAQIQIIAPAQKRIQELNNELMALENTP